MYDDSERRVGTFLSRTRLRDQIVLGDDLIVVPVVEKGGRSRFIILPEGKWKEGPGKIHAGGLTI